MSEFCIEKSNSAGSFLAAVPNYDELSLPVAVWVVFYSPVKISYATSFFLMAQYLQNDALYQSPWNETKGDVQDALWDVGMCREVLSILFSENGNYEEQHIPGDHVALPLL